MHAEIAREIVTRNDWTTAYANGVPVQSSSRALDWSIAASYKLFGVADWSARMPIALCVLALAVIVFFFGRSLFVWNAAGLYAALIVLVWPGTFLATRDLSAAPLLCLAATLLAFTLWQMILVQKLPLWSAAAVTVLVCAIALLTGNGQACFLLIVIALAVWVAHTWDQPGSRSGWLLSFWALSAVVFIEALESPPHNLWFWISPVPPLALLLGGWLADKEAFAGKATLRRIAYSILGVCLVLAGIALVFALHGPANFAVFRQSVTVTAGTTRIPLLILAAALLAGATGYLISILRGKARIANCFLAGMLGGVTVAIQAALVIGSPFVSSQILADAIRPELEPTDLVVIDGRYPDASSFAFYLERPILIALPAGSTPPTLVSRLPVGVVSVDEAWKGTARVYLWTRTGRPRPVPGQSYVVASSGGKEILSNQPNSGGAAF
jgi:4-amino-4-deoxy-L-arabinose transferase-like glycosyltransferase